MSDELLTLVVIPTALFSFIVAAVTWSRRHTSRPAMALAVLLVSLGIWDLAYGLRTANVPAPNEHLWLSIMYVGVATTPTTLLVFALHFARLEHWLTMPVKIALAIEPVLVILAAWTDSQFGLLFGGKAGVDLYLRQHAGPVFWVNVIYSYTLMAISTSVLLRHRWSHRHGLFRRQTAIVIFGVCMPWLGSVLLVLNLTQRDMTPVTVSVAAFVFSYSILRFRLLEVAPIARDLVIERMSDGVLVVDSAGVISDINPMGRRLLGITDLDPVGKHFTDCLHHQPKLAAMLRTSAAGRVEVQLSTKPLLFVDITVSTLEDHKRQPIGALALVRDITDRKHLEDELERLAAVDPLTGIGNRRHFDESVERELQRRARTGKPLSIALIDMDHLKQVNDRNGHSAGDVALQFLAQVMKRSARTIDVPARLGGDEFALLLTDTSAEDAAAAMERMRRDFRRMTDADERLHGVSISVGIATATHEANTPDAITRLADTALYEAKSRGRDRICIAEQLPSQPL